MADDCWLIVGLGNPGDSYARTRHNVGAMALDELAGRVGGRFKAGKNRYLALEGRVAGQRAVLVRPTSYMNDSGGPVAAAAGYYRVPPERLIVLHDELDLPFTTLRLKAGGGHGGHNGLRDIEKALGARDYLRVRLGIGRPPGRQDPAEFVLREFSPAERKEVPLMTVLAADAVEAVLGSGLDAAQLAFHTQGG